MSNSHSSPDYHQCSQHTSVYRRIARITRQSPDDRSSRIRQHRLVDHPFILGLEATITPHNYQSVAHSVGITIINVSSRDLVESLLRRHDIEDNLNARSSQHWGNSLDYSQATGELIDDQEAYMEEKEEDAILLGYFNTRTHCVADRVNNPTETEEICVICQAEFEHEESIGTLGCGHAYHTGCIKQWLLRKKDCPICRALFCPEMHSI